MADRIRAGRPTAAPDAPDRIAALLADARGRGVTVVHVHHDDPNPDSPFRKGAPAAAPTSVRALSRQNRCGPPVKTPSGRPVM